MRSYSAYFIVVFIVISYLATLFAFDRSFFYYDDMQHYFLPHIISINKMVANGIFPAINSSSWAGGYIAGEFQFSIYNPLTILLYQTIRITDNFHYASLLLAGVVCIGIALTIYSISTKLTISPAWSIFATTTFITGNYFTYWIASSWFNCLLSIFWLLLSFRILISQNTPWKPIKLTSSLYALFVSGFPPYAAIFPIIAMIWIMYTPKHRKKEAFITIASIIAASILAMPAIYPIASYLRETSRITGFFSNGSMVSGLDIFLHLGTPFFTPFISTFGYFQKATESPYYLSWIFIPLTILTDYKKIKEDKTICFLFFCTLSILILSLGPETVSFARWPIRLIPLGFAFGAILMARLTSLNYIVLDNTRIKYLFYFVMFISFSTLQNNPNNLSPLLTITPLSILFVLLNKHNELFLSKNQAVIYSIIAFFLFIISHALYLKNDNFGDYNDQENQQKIQAFMGKYDQSILVLTPTPLTKNQYKLPTGNTSIHSDKLFINGYSPVLMKGYKNNLCFNMLSYTKCSPIQYLSLTDATVKTEKINLFGINSILMTKKFYREWKQKPWIGWTCNLLHNDPVDIVACSRDEKYTKLTHMSENLFISGATYLTNKVGGTYFSADVTNNSSTAGRIILSRPWYPGYTAKFNGHPARVVSHDGIILSVEIPEKSSGHLIVNYELPGLFLMLPCYMLALILLLGTCLTLKHRGKIDLESV